MENQQSKDATDEGKGCCAKGKCCGCKALAAAALLALGGVGGYFVGRRCAKSDAAASVGAPAQPK